MLAWRYNAHGNDGGSSLAGSCGILLLQQVYAIVPAVWRQSTAREVASIDTSFQKRKLPGQVGRGMLFESHSFATVTKWPVLSFFCRCAHTCQAPRVSVALFTQPFLVVFSSSFGALNSPLPRVCILGLFPLSNGATLAVNELVPLHCQPLSTIIRRKPGGVTWTSEKKRRHVAARAQG